MQSILAIDDELSVRESYRLIFSDQYNVLLADGGRKALEIIEKTHVDLILLDLMMPSMSGMEVLQELASRGEHVPVVVITGLNSVTSAVEAIKLGAVDFVIKPFDVDELCLIASRILEEQRERRELEVYREADCKAFESIIGKSESLKKALSLARRAMEVDSTVLITGESGTGKDMIARAIHFGGQRAAKPFVPISCCAIPPQLVESELFGHEKGAFTGADEKRIGKMQVADGGTLFLDEIGEMPLDAQSKLLRVLQDNCFYAVGSTKVVEVDLRIICATNRNLPEAVEKGIFRNDLFYRINVLQIEMPPLRQRREDIPALVEYFIRKHAPRVNARTTGFDPKAIASLASCAWPGNVRELENTIERVLVHHGGKDTIEAADVADLLPPSPGDREARGMLSDLDGLPLEEATRRVERRLITRALERSDYVQSKAADLLGTTRRVLKYKMDQLNIPPTPEEAEAGLPER